MNYDKPALPVEKQITLLCDRGLAVTDADRAKRYLQIIGYYRLSAYFFPFQSKKDTFIPGSSFDDVLELYIADRKLRLLAMDAMERIEVAVRTVISNEMSMRCEPHWYMDVDSFLPSFYEDKQKNNRTRFEELIASVEHSTGFTCETRRNLSCRHYFDHYNSPQLPPSWMIIEVLPMGAWSKIYSGIRKTEYKKRIASYFNFHHKDFGSWIHALTLVRNCLAHHCRFWNHAFPSKAVNLAYYTHKGILPSTPYTNFAMIQAMLRSFTHKSTWSEKLSDMLGTWPSEIVEHMQFPDNWQQMDFWQR